MSARNWPIFDESAACRKCGCAEVGASWRRAGDAAYTDRLNIFDTGRLDPALLPAVPVRLARRAPGSSGDMTGRHRPVEPPPRPPMLAAHHRWISITCGAVLTAGLTFAVVTSAVDFAPDGTRAATVAAPTVIEKTREPSGKGGPIAGPVTGPSFATDAPVWTEDKGPVVVNGKALHPAPAPITTATAEPTPPTPAPEPTAGLPAVEAATPPPTDPAPPTGLLALVNADRVANGCAPVVIADDLMSQAQTHSNGQAAADSMFHSAAGPEGYDSWGENVGQGYDTEADVESAWMASDGHRANITNCSFLVIGFAYADSATGVRYWTQEFGA